MGRNTDSTDFDRLDALAAAALRARQAEGRDARYAWPSRRSRPGRVVPRLVLGVTAWWLLGVQAIALLE